MADLVQRKWSAWGADHWALLGSRGAVEFYLLHNQTHLGGISIHSPHQLYDFAPDPERDCHLLEGPCWGDGSSLHAERLAEEWQQAGRDDEVIWTELREWYTTRFGRY